MDARLAQIGLAITIFPDGPLKIELIKREGQLLQMRNDAFADRELLKKEYWGHYDEHSAENDLSNLSDYND